jgi:predicted transcriptional regulator
MKARKLSSTPEPTKSELEILQVLWKHGPSTVRFVNDYLRDNVRPVQYTSTLKLMQIMTEKKMLARDEQQMKHIYSPLLDEQSTKGSLINQMVDSLFDGSKANLVMQLFGNSKSSRKELEEIKEMLRQIDKKGTNK